MRLNGEWLQCEDGDIRPVIRGELLGADGIWRGVEFLVDTGADRTVFTARSLEDSLLPHLPPDRPIGGFGGFSSTVVIESPFRVAGHDGVNFMFRGRFAACTDHEALELTVLGRDILDMLALIVDRRADVVAIVGQNHGYTIHKTR